MALYNVNNTFISANTVSAQCSSALLKCFLNVTQFSGNLMQENLISYDRFSASIRTKNIERSNAVAK